MTTPTSPTTGQNPRRIGIGARSGRQGQGGCSCEYGDCSDMSHDSPPLDVRCAERSTLLSPRTHAVLIRPRAPLVRMRVPSGSPRKLRRVYLLVKALPSGLTVAAASDVARR